MKSLFYILIGMMIAAQGVGFSRSACSQTEGENVTEMTEEEAARAYEKNRKEQIFEEKQKRERRQELQERAIDEAGERQQRTEDQVEEERIRNLRKQAE